MLVADSRGFVGPRLFLLGWIVTRTITALEVQKRDSERVNVYLDGEFAFGLPALEASRLRTGQELTDTEIDTLRQIDAVARGVDYVVKLLARRPYSTTEIRRKLAAQETAPPVIDEVLDRLKHYGYVDDLAFARYWIENRERFRPRGSNALRYELRSKGLAPDIIEQVLAELDPLDSAIRAAQPRVRSFRGVSRQEFRNKLGSFLARRGFGYDVAHEATNQIMTELEAEDPDYFANEQSDEE